MSRRLEASPPSLRLAPTSKVVVLSLKSMSKFKSMSMSKVPSHSGISVRSP